MFGVVGAWRGLFVARFGVGVGCELFLFSGVGRTAVDEQISFDGAGVSTGVGA